jgi:hypothetical protein
MAASTVLLNPKAPEFQMPYHSFNPDAPEFKPVEATLRPEAAEFFPMSGGWATLQVAAEAYQNNKQKRAMPFATDEEWEQRITKREKEVDTIKSLQSYRLYIEVFPPEARGQEDPKTPDPRDRTVSKRMWKWNVEKWRLQLKSRCVYSRAVLLQFREMSKTALAPVGTDDSADDVAKSGPFLDRARTEFEGCFAPGEGAVNSYDIKWRTEPVERPRSAVGGSRKASGGPNEARSSR